jgi:aldehyde:ferredoxin oxidoreductase
MDLNMKVLFVDLTEGTIEKKAIPVALRKKFLGGRGIDDYILLTHIEPGIDPLGPENYLSIGAGILSGIFSGVPIWGETSPPR